MVGKNGNIIQDGGYFILVGRIWDAIGIINSAHMDFCMAHIQWTWHLIKIASVTPAKEVRAHVPHVNVRYADYQAAGIHYLPFACLGLIEFKYNSLPIQDYKDPEIEALQFTVKI